MIVEIWSGACNAGEFIGGDGLCHAAQIAGVTILPLDPPFIVLTLVVVALWAAVYAWAARRGRWP